MNEKQAPSNCVSKRSKWNMRITRGNYPTTAGWQLLDGLDRYTLEQQSVHSCILHELNI